MQSEVADASLLTAAVDLTHDLDARFGLPPKITISQAGPRIRYRAHACSFMPASCMPLELLARPRSFEGVLLPAEGRARAHAERHPRPQQRWRARDIHRRQRRQRAARRAQEHALHLAGCAQQHQPHRHASPRCAAQCAAFLFTGRPVSREPWQCVTSLESVVEHCVPPHDGKNRLSSKL